MNSLSLKVDLDFKELMKVVKQLSPAEKLKLNEEIWKDDNIEIPEEHQKIVLNRIEKSKNSPERMLDWDDVSDLPIQ
ncbi:addiction module protein [Flavobacterium chungbukense]|uniref:Addiction module component n=1 Tax=Flavobacterium chungbukense TaxID=877464 RepID=A0ABP7YHP5_9FLAO|nr:addiction module protein [Flavobacterium chungbukense]MCC4920289.1 addiction module protein [Flavobacterium chungbukense]